MSFFKLRPAAGAVWPALPNGPASQLWALYLELERTQWLSPAEIVEGQLAQLRTLVAHCSANIPYYRDLLRDAGVVPEDIRTLADYRRIPTLKRQTWMQQFPNLQARALPPGVVKTSETTSGGTSGVPVTLWQTNHVALWGFACSLRDLHWNGFDPRGTLATIRVASKNIPREIALAGFRAPIWNRQLHAIMETGPLFAMDVQQAGPLQLEWLMRVQPDYLLSYAANLDYLAELLRESGQRIPHLRLVQNISETLTSDAKTRIESGFGVPVKNTYSCGEAGYLASPCPEGHGLHVHAENVLVEVLDDNDQPCGPGETGRVVLTTLHNHSTPFLRYDIQDRITLGPERCPCGRGLPLLAVVHGKERPLFRMADGRRVSSSHLAQRLRELDLAYQYQIVQRAVDHFVIRLIPSRKWSAESKSHLVQFVLDYLQTPVRVDVELVERLAGPSGKVNAVVIEMA